MFLIDEGKLFFGAAIDFNGIWIYPLHLNEIIGMGQNTYDEYLSFLAQDIREIQKELKKQGVSENDMPGSSFEYLMLQAQVSMNFGVDNGTFLMKLQKAFSTFIREKVHFSFDTQEIIVGEDLNNRRVLNKDNFEDFQNILRAQNKLPVPEPIPENESAMARKFRLRREQLAEVKRKQALKNGESVSLLDSISTLVCFNVGVNFQNVGNLTMYQFKELLARAQTKYKYDLDIRMIAAGADPKKIKPKHWFGKIEN
jgi:hypothetical protein